MKITLSKVSYELPDDGLYPVFKTDLIIDGTHAGTASNQGYGAATTIDPINDHGRALIKKAEAYCRKDQLAFKNSEGYGEFWITRTLALTVDQQMFGHIFRDEDANPEIKRKHDHARKIATLVDKEIDPIVQQQRDMLIGILVGLPDDYYVYDYGLPLARILDNPSAEKFLVPELMKIHNQLGKGSIILNTNIPEHVLRKAGFSAKHHAALKVPASNEKSQAKRKGKRL